ncbi:MAG: cyclic nucleotide-binding domain-containing protein [Myxococcota bacterium]
MKPEALKRFSLFAELTEEEREIVASLLERRTLPKGKSVFREGAESDGLVLLESGRLKLRSGRTQAVVGTLAAPDHLGAASLFSLGKREVTAMAEGPCTIFTLSRSALARLVDDAPRAGYRLAAAVALELAGLARQSLDPLARADPDGA